MSSLAPGWVRGTHDSSVPGRTAVTGSGEPGGKQRQSAGPVHTPGKLFSATQSPLPAGGDASGPRKISSARPSQSLSS